MLFVINQSLCPARAGFGFGTAEGGIENAKHIFKEAKAAR